MELIPPIATIPKELTAPKVINPVEFAQPKATIPKALPPIAIIPTAEPIGFMLITPAERITKKLYNTFCTTFYLARLDSLLFRILYHN
jgi:hypothetical protein